MPTWPFALVAWLGDVSAVLLIAMRTYRLIFRPEDVAEAPPSRRWNSMELSRDAVAVIGFVVLFALMLLRVPVGMAMGLVGVSGFGYLVGGDPALKMVGQTSMRIVTDYTFGVIPMFLLMGAIVSRSGMSRELFQAAKRSSAIGAAGWASPPSPPALGSPRSAVRRWRPPRRSRPLRIRKCGASAIRSPSPPA